MADEFSDMTEKQGLFIEYYLVSFNATKAALKAGYSEKTAYITGHENLRKPKIKAAIHKRVAEIIAKTDDKRVYLINFWQSIIESETSQERDRIKASELLAKYMAMFTEQLEISNKDDKPFKVTWE